MRQSEEVSGSFGGTTAAYYAMYRRGYPDEFISTVADRLHLGSGDTVLALGCGTGLLTVPFARRVRSVVAVDPEPEMLAEARRAVDPAIDSRIVWVLAGLSWLADSRL